MHIFALFPIVFYAIFINSTGKLYSPTTRRIMALLGVIVLVSHVFQAKGWLTEYPTFFMPLNTNMVSQFISIPFSGKATIVVAGLVSIFIFHKLFS
jgi:hypothetical protein